MRSLIVQLKHGMHKLNSGPDSAKLTSLCPNVNNSWLLASLEGWCLAVIEKFTRNTRFCLICNYVSKIIPALQSRCTRFRFPPLEEDFVRKRLSQICEEERHVFFTPVNIASKLHSMKSGTYSQPSCNLNTLA